MYAHSIKGAALVGLVTLIVVNLSHAEVLPPITPSGLHTQVSGPSAVGGHTQYDITGGTRPGGVSGTNLFHSFGDFSVPTNNIANFLNAGSVDQNGHVLDSNLPTSNILGRVTGGGPSVIFGMIQTNGPNGFGTANLFLMNPAGFLFGPNATVNVGGMMTFTTADYLRFQGTDTLFNKVSTPESLSLLSTVPVVAFGFLGSNPAAIAIQGSTLQVVQGQSLSFVGGNTGFKYIDPDTGIRSSTSVPGGVTMTGGKLLALGGQINIASVASPGEVSAADFMPASGMTMGNISLSQGALLDVSADAAGTVRIRGGQFELLNSSVHADTGEAPGAETAIDVRVTGDLSISNDSVSAFTARALGSGNAGEIRLDSGKMDVNIAFPEYGVVIDSSTVGSGNAGKVTVTTGDLKAVNTSTGGFGVFIDSGTGGTGNGGDVTIKVRNGDFLGAAINTGDSFFFGTGSAGNLYVGGTNGMADSLHIDGAPLSTEAFSAKGGAITLEAHDISLTNNTFVSSTSLLGENPITINADQLSMDNVIRVQGQTIGAGNGGDIVFTGKRLEMSNESAFITSTLGDGHAGNIRVTANEYVHFVEDPRNFTPSGLYSDSIGMEGVTTSGNAGSIHVMTTRLEMTGGARINTTTHTAGRGGDAIITASEGIFISGQRTKPAPGDSFGLGEGNGSGIYTRTVGIDQCGEACGRGGDQIITTGHLVLQNGGVLDSGTTGNGKGGNIVVKASNDIVLSGTLIDGTPSGIFSRTIGTASDSGPGGNIVLTAGQSVAISDGASVSASSTGPGSTGNIQINAGNQFVMTNNSTVTTEANLSSGGLIKITTDPGGTVQLTNSLISASVLDGTGGGGSVSIDPQYVILLNSQILAQAVQGPGGNISITTNFLLPDANSVISASSQFGVNGTITIQSTNAPASGKIQPLGKSPLQATSLLNQRCASLAGGEFSSFTVAGRDSMPTEPGSWLASPLYAAGTGLGVKAEGGRPVARGEGLEDMTLRSSLADEPAILSLRQIAPAGFLTQAFAVDWSASCQS